MTNEQLRMQFIGGIITESEYKAKIEENKSPKSKKSLNENIVSIGAINNPFPKREKSDYELAFEHFSKGGLNEEEDNPFKMGSNMYAYMGGVNEASNMIKEGSFTDQMNPDTRELYSEYIQNIDIFNSNKINNHQKLSDEMVKDPRVQKNSQKRLLQQALGWAITYAQEMER